MLTLLAASLLSLTQAQDSKFESSDYGIRLKIPAGWNIDATRQARVILKLNLSGDYPFKPELLVYELQFGEPVTIQQYKEQLRQYLQRIYKDARLMDDQDTSVGGRKGFILTVVSKGQNEVDAISHKGAFEISPRRMLAIDGVFPRASDETLAKVYTSLLESVEFIARTKQGGTEEGLKKFQELLPALVKAPEGPVDQKDELESFVGEKKIGTYTTAYRSATVDGVAGLQIETVTAIDLGEEKVESTVKGFLSWDFLNQRVELTETKAGKDKRQQYFTAVSTLSAGQITTERRINGEKCVFATKAPEPFLFSELAEVLQYRLLGVDKSLVNIPVLSAFENEPGFIKIERAGLHKMKVDEEMLEVEVCFLLREDGVLRTYWYDPEKRLTRVSASGQSYILKRKK